MIACLGLNDGYQGPRFDADHLIERWPRVDVFWLNRIGALVPGASTALEWDTVGGPRPSRTFNVLRGGSGVAIDGTRLALAWDSPMEGVDRPWWKCPRCSARCRFVFLRGDTIACRRCLRLDYASRHLRRQTPGVGRVERLRRKLGDCEPKPFAPLPVHIRRGRSRAYHDALVAAILDEESKLLGHLQTVTHDLERRIRVRKERGKW